MPTEPILSANHPKFIIDSTIEAHNMTKLDHVHRLLGIVLGISAGILGLSNFFGVFFYILTMAFCNVVIYSIVVQNQVTAFKNYKKILTRGFTSEAASFLFFWALIYNLIYVYS